MKLFLADLDNTLIYSHRREIGPDKENVEWYEGRQISFMTKKSQQLLRIVQENMLFVPCTTRSIAQYQRIRLLPDWSPAYALVANGGILLKDGCVEQTWFEESKERFQVVNETMQQARYFLEQLPALLLPIRMVDELFLFTKCADAERVQQWLEQQLDSAQVQVLIQGQKLYVVPQTLTKGVALQRMRDRYPEAFFYAAGDSCFDVPMLLRADFAFAPESLAPEIEDQSCKLVVDDCVVFSDAILTYLVNLCC